MILNDVTITYINGEEDTVSDVKYMAMDNGKLELNCIHGMDIYVPTDDIDIITINRRWDESEYEDGEWKYTDSDSLKGVDDAGEDETEVEYKSRIL